VKARCVCGCGRRAVQLHHAVYVQEIRWRAAAAKGRKFQKWRADMRNLLPIAHECHGAHHARSRPLPVHVLPDGVFEFASELMGAGAAYEYISRRYRGGDPRLEALLS
jgi:hypothetical protein